MRKFLYIVLVLLSLPLVASIVRPGFFPMQDDFGPIRIFEMDKCVKDGQLPCRWSPDLGFGYGYPEFNYYAPLPYYAMEGFHLLGASYLDSVKIFIVFITIAAGVGMFLFTSSLWGDTGGIVSTILYLYLPYRAVDVYVRGDIGELAIFAILPFLFWAVREVSINKNCRKRNIFFLVVFLFILFTSHNIGAVMVMPAILIWFFSFREKDKIVVFGLSIAWAISLSAFFLVPAWFEKNLVHIDTLTSGYFNYLAHFLDIKQILFSMHWGYGVDQLGPNDDINLSIGILQWILPLVGVIFSIFLFIKRKSIDLKFIVLVFIGVICLFLTHSKSTVIWDSISILKYFQFPWRFLLLAGFTFSAAAGYFFKIFDKRKFVYFLVVVIFVISYLLYGGFFRPKEWNYITDAQKLSGDNLTKAITASLYDYLPVAAKRAPDTKALMKPQFLNGNGEILLYRAGSDWQNSLVKVNSATANLQFQIYYYPNWEILIDGVKSKINYSNEFGLMTILVPRGRHSIEAKLKNTNIRMISNIISLVALVSFIIYLCSKRFY